MGQRHWGHEALLMKVVENCECEYAMVVSDAPPVGFPVRIELPGYQLVEMIEVQLHQWNDWAARFSCNPGADVWPCPSFGYSTPSHRNLVTGAFPVLDQIVELVLARRPLGGRFFVCEHGAWTFDEVLGGYLQLVEFVLCAPVGVTARCPGHA